MDSWIADGIKAGSRIINSKEEVEAEVIDKKLSSALPVIMRYESGSDRFVFSSDITRKDCEVTVDIATVKIGDYNYFARTQRIKVGDMLSLPFPEANFTGSIISIASVN